MTTRRRSKQNDEQATPDLVTVSVTAGRAVYWAGEQRGGVIADVPRELATRWAKAGYAVIEETPTSRELSGGPNGAPAAPQPDNEPTDNEPTDEPGDEPGD